VSEYGLTSPSTQNDNDMILLNIAAVIGHFGDESFQSITCTGTDNLKTTT